MKIIKIDQLDGTVEKLMIRNVNKETCEAILWIFGFDFNKTTGYWHTENEMVGLDEEEMFIIPLPGLVTTDGKQQYLTHRDNTFFAYKRENELRQIWAESQLKFIPDIYRQLAVEFDEGEELEDDYKK